MIVSRDRFHAAVRGCKREVDDAGDVRFEYFTSNGNVVGCIERDATIETQPATYYLYGWGAQ